MTTKRKQKPLEDCQMEKEFTVGDSLWFVSGYSGERLIAIRCTVTEVDDYFRKKHPDANLFYWVDEPIGHAVSGPDDHEVFESKEDAVEELLGRYQECVEFDIEENGEIDPKESRVDANLDEYRASTEHFIRLTHENNGYDHPGFPKWPEKQPGIDWVNIEMARKLKA